MASTAVSTSPWPVMTTTGSSGSTCCERRSSSIPSMPSILRSVTRMPGKSVLNAASAAAALSWTSSWKPASPSHCVTAWRMAASSSTNRIGPWSGMHLRLRADRLREIARQFHGQFGATLGPVRGADLAVEVLDDAVGDRQTEPQSLADRLGGEERVEDAIELRRRNSGTVVRDHDRNGLGGRAKAYPDPGLLHARQRVERIAQEIEDHLLELHRGADDPKVRLQILLDAHAGGLDLALDEKERPLERACHQHRLEPARLALAREGLQVRGDRRHAVRQSRDQIEVAGHLRKLAAFGEDFRARHEGTDGGERLIDLVRDGGRHLPERRELAGLHQLVLGGPQPRLDSAVLVDFGLQRGIRFAELAGALGHLAFEAGAHLLRRHIGAMSRDDIEHERNDQRRDGAA